MSDNNLDCPIHRYFEDLIAVDDARNECVSMCKTFNISPEDLKYKLEAVCYNAAQTTQIITHDTVRELRANLEAERAKNDRAAAMPRKSVALLRGRGLQANVSVSKMTETLPGPLNSRKLNDAASTSTLVFRGPEMDHASVKNRAYRYMHEKILERSEVLDNRIDEFAELIQRHYHIDEFGDPASVTEVPITVVGRIVVDAEAVASGVKVNESSLRLESSRMMGSGVRVPIRLTSVTKLRGGIKGVDSFSLFPGAIVALRGRNVGGEYFLADEILALPTIRAPPPPLSDPDGSFSMCIACGPFTAETDLHFKPWSHLLQNLNSTKPAVVLLIGPFIDSSHTRVMQGEIDEDPQQLFKSKFIDTLEQFLKSSIASTIMLVPSVRDIISDHAVFPQCELDSSLGQHPRIHFLPNPSRFSVNGISFGVTSVDVLFHLRKEEFAKKFQQVDAVATDYTPSTDSMTNLARNILQQRSFYPIFPVPCDVSHEVNFDVTHSAEVKLIESPDECAPEVLILPSRLKQFSKVVDTSVVINPSFLSKGSYATLFYNSEGPGLLQGRIRIEMSKVV